MLCGTSTTGGGGTTATDSVLDCRTVLQEYQQNTDCQVENIEEVTPDSMACTSECKTLAYNLADACGGVRSMWLLVSCMRSIV